MFPTTARSALVSILLPSLIVASAIVGGGSKAAGTAGPESQTETATTEVTEPAAPAAAKQAEEDNEQTEDEAIFTDDEGKAYRLLELQKAWQNKDWMYMPDGKVRVRYGMEYELLREDEQKIWLKVPLRSHDTTATSILKAPTGPSPAEIEAIESSYAVELAEVDTLVLEAFDRGLPRSGQWRNGFDLADMNSDGHQDIVFGASRKSSPARPTIFLGDGAGSWERWNKLRLPPFPYDYGDAEAADFDGDGHFDLALGMHLKGVLVLRGDGEGGFTSWSEGIGLERPGQGGDASTFSSRAIVAADWNGDGRTDLLAMGEGPKGVAIEAVGGDLKSANGPIVFLNQGEGLWRAHGYQASNFGDDIELGDFNGDGRTDFVTASNQLGNRYILHLGGAGAAWVVERLAELRSKGVVRAVASAHLNDDQRSDLVIGYSASENGVWRTGVDVIYSSGENSWLRKPLYAEESKAGIYALAAGDLDGDGRVDLAAGDGNGNVRLFLADGNGFFAAESSPEIPDAISGCRVYALELQDLDGDGRSEVIAGFAGEGVSLPGVLAAQRGGCPNDGSLRAWSPAPRSLAPAAAPAS